MSEFIAITYDGELKAQEVRVDHELDVGQQYNDISAAVLL